MTARVVMLQGTASSVGKSVLCAGLCRLFRQAGHRVAPFKAQNMALNSFATPEGLEIGRAQAVQAAAAGVAPHVDMNPVLLKPEAESRAQVVVLGKPAGTMSARDYFQRKVDLWPVVSGALDRLRAAYDVVVIEGAGSPAEVNLRDREIVNMRVARYAQAPVLLVGDIDRGGVMASLVGTLELLLPEERALVKGLIVNRFRGDVSLFRDGVRFLEERTGLPVLGVVPYDHGLRVADEDSVALEGRPRGLPLPGKLVDVAVLRLPHIANFDDFVPLEAEPAVGLRYVAEADDLGWPDILIVPGTKATMADLAWLRRSRLAERVVGLAAAGTAVLGICGGYQMLGVRICDPLRIESAEAEVPGLGLLPVETSFLPQKTTQQVQAQALAAAGPLAAAAGAAITAYEIHMGQTRRVLGTLSGRAGDPLGPSWGPERAGDAETQRRRDAGTRRPRHPSPQLGPRGSPAPSPQEAAFLLADGRHDGCVGAGGTVVGTYLHGLLDNAPVRRALVAWAAERKGVPLDTIPSAVDDREAQYDRLAALLRTSLDTPRLYEIVGLREE